MRQSTHVTIAADGNFSVSEREEHMLGGGVSEALSADKGHSGDATAGGRKGEGTSKYMFKSAIKETLQIKKVDSRERYTSYLCIVVFVSVSHLIGPLKTSTTGR
jgi:hypothetical protein